MNSSEEISRQVRAQQFHLNAFRANIAELRANYAKQIELLTELERAVVRDHAAGKLPYQVLEWEEALAEAERIKGMVP